MKKRGILITGTTRGIGKELKRKFEKTHYILSVNRVINEDSTKLEICFENCGVIIKGDICNTLTWKTVKKHCQENFIEIEKIFFNAGVNIPENDNNINIALAFNQNLNTNFLSIICAINELGIEFSKKFIALSSMSTIYPNPNNISYSLSKTSCELLFSTLSKKNKANKFQIIRLGPVKTDFTKNLLQTSSATKRAVFEIIALSSEHCAELIKKRSDSDKTIVNLPFRAILIYIPLKIMRSIFKCHKSYIFPL